MKTRILSQEKDTDTDFAIVLNQCHLLATRWRHWSMENIHKTGSCQLSMLLKIWRMMRIASRIMRSGHAMEQAQVQQPQKLA